MSRILHYHWRVDQPGINFGEGIVDRLIHYCGHDPVGWRGDPSGFDSIHLLIGTFVDDRHLGMFPLHKNVWGCGGGGLPLDPNRKDVTFHAVRGPKTRDFYHLPADIPLGDPGLLLPEALPLELPEDRVESAYCPHFKSRVSEDRRSVGAKSFIDIGTTRGAFHHKAREIIAPHFLATGSLHACIIRSAYAKALGIELPWALCIPPGKKLNQPFKHQDWAEFLGVEFRVVSSVSEGERWWRDQGSHGSIPDLGPLKAACPFGWRHFQDDKGHITR